MSKAIVNVDAGICGCGAKITAQSQDGQMAEVKFETTCPNLKQFESKLTEVDAFSTCFGHPCDSSIYKMLNEQIPHSTCPVPSGIIKAVEVACGFALAKDASIKVEKED